MSAASANETRLIPVTKWNEHHHWPPIGGLRHLIFNAIYARPDDTSDIGPSWRDALLKYNANPGNNSLGLCRAGELYGNAIYRRLGERYGPGNTYILSAGWGLISASFLTPNYDITFSPSADRYKRRKKSDTYLDLCMVPDNSTEDLYFFGGKDYQPLFEKLTQSFKGKRTIFYNSAIKPQIPNCALRKFSTRTRTNWHYECANAFLRGDI